MLEDVIRLLVMAAAVAGAMGLGHWFLGEVKKCKAQKIPVYKAYFTPPGILIIVALMVPVFLNVFWR